MELHLYGTFLVLCTTQGALYKFVLVFVCISERWINQTQAIRLESHYTSGG